jgi:hypothetical protein
VEWSGKKKDNMKEWFERCKSRRDGRKEWFERWESERDAIKEWKEGLISIEAI